MDDLTGNQGDAFEAEVKKTAKKKPKQKWHFYVLLGILLLLIFLCVGSMVLSSLKKAFSAKKQPQYTQYTYSYVDTVNNLDLSKRPDTVSDLQSGAFDYTFINEAVTKTPEEVDQWITTYYPNGYTKKGKMENNVEWWVITSSTPMPPISIDGYVFRYDQVELHFRDGYAENIKFVVTQGGTQKDFYTTYYALEGKYGTKQLYTPKKDFFERLMEPDTEYLSFSWTDSEFDGFYWLSVVRSVHPNEEENYILFAVD